MQSKVALKNPFLKSKLPTLQPRTLGRKKSNKGNEIAHVKGAWNLFVSRDCREWVGRRHGRWSILIKKKFVSFFLKKLKKWICKHLGSYNHLLLSRQCDEDGVLQVEDVQRCMVTMMKPTVTLFLICCMQI